MTRNIIALIGLALLAGCSGGGGDSATPPSAPAPSAQPDMITATPAGLLRGKASGQGQHEIFHFPNLHKEKLFVDNGNIVYPRNNQTDIWTVHTDGTGDHALLSTANREFLQALSWPWVIYSDESDFFYKSLNTDTRAQFPIDGSPGTIQFKDNRVIVASDLQISSVSFTGTDRISYARSDTLVDEQLSSPTIVADMLVYRGLTLVSPFASTFSSNLFAIPFIGGSAIPFDSGQSYVSFAGSIGARVIYHRCPLVSQNTAGPCDVVSVRNDGTNSIVLASQPVNESVQGVTTNQVIIRRNLSGNDQLIAVPIAGGAEIPLMTMTDSEFVDLIVGDQIIVRRPSGTWRLDLNGTLTKLGTVVGDSGFIAVGDSVCVTKVTAVWCMPLDGSGPQVEIASEGKVVGEL